MTAIEISQKFSGEEIALLMVQMKGLTYKHMSC